jgi:multicomponent Na+:H+ antiporter subunit F
MMADGPEFLRLAIDITFLMVIFAVLLAFIRLARGPSLPDRVVALDMMTILIVAFCGLFALFSGEAAFLDVAIVMALIGFLATVALARFAERRQALAEERNEEEDS